MSAPLPPLPELPLEDWEETKKTLHLMFQVMGKVRMALTPRRNHWWNATLYLSPRGLTTGPIAYAGGMGSIELQLNLMDHRLEIISGDADTRTISLGGGLSLAAFHEQLMATLGDFGIRPRIVARPYDLPVKTPFAQMTDPAPYDPEPVGRYLRVMRWVDCAFGEFSGRFYGKTCPVHLYWHHMDLAVTRFSGKAGPALPADRSIPDKDAYTHEVVSFGFWPGDEKVRGAAFYSYTYPAPDGLDAEPLAPDAAAWIDAGGSPMATCMYHDLLKEPDPRAALMAFLESTYQAGAKHAGWEIDGFAVPPLEAL